METDLRILFEKYNIDDYLFNKVISILNSESEPIINIPQVNLPKYEDYNEDNYLYEQALITAMMSGTLSEDNLKEAFRRLSGSNADRYWLANAVWNSPRNRLWRINNGRLQFNRDILLPRGSEWIDIREIYDDELFGCIGDLLQN
jgi:hypothetical protein